MIDKEDKNLGMMDQDQSLEGGECNGSASRRIHGPLGGTR